MRPANSPLTDTRERVSDAEEVEVHAVLGSESSPDGARQGQNQRRVRRDQTDQSPAQDGSHADGGALCVRALLPAHQHPQPHEKVITPAAPVTIKIKELLRFRHPCFFLISS